MEKLSKKAMIQLANLGFYVNNPDMYKRQFQRTTKKKINKVTYVKFN